MSSGIRRLLAGVLALGLATPAGAQQQAFGTITGRVLDRASQRPVVSAQVRVVGTPRGAQTDENGVYRITGVPAGPAQLVAQRIGYGPSPRAVTVVASTTITADFALAVSATQLDQVLVTATGMSERRRENGASTASVSVSDLPRSTVVNFSDVLSSRSPGVVVQTSAGESGAGSRIRIRGSNSISLSNDPLLIIDGVRVDNSSASTAIGTGGQQPSRFNDINPEEIETYEVIKGPAAAALYGTAASNGVIQITTKKGRAGRTRWEAFGEAGSLTDVNSYPANFRAYGHNAANALVTNCTLYARSAGSCVAVDSVVSNTPIAAAGMTADGNRRLAGLSASGGSDALTYFLSGEYQQEQNVITINNRRQVNIRSNLRAQLAKSLDATLSVGFTNTNLRRPQNDNNAFGVVSGSLLGRAADCFGAAAAALHPALCSGGADTVSRGYFNPGLDPKAFYNINTVQGVQRITSGLTSNWTPMSWLVVNSTFGADIDNRTDTETLYPNLLAYSQNTLDGYRGVYRAQSNNYTASLNGTGTWDLTPQFKLTAAAGTQFTDVFFARTDAFGAKLLSGTNSLNGTNARFSVGETTNDVRTLGYLGRVQGAWRDRLFVTAAERTDKNSAFGVNYPRIYYPSLSASYVISDEDFFPKAGGLSSLRLRAAWGSAGQNPGYLSAEQYFNPVAVVVGGVDFPGFTVGGAGNPNLKPEKSTEKEGGFDLGLLSDRVNLEYTYYSKVTRDALVNVNLAPSLGSSNTRFMNLGQVSNWGHEFLLRASVIDRSAFKFDFTLNGTFNRNMLDTLGYDPNGNPVPAIFAGFSSTQIIKTGQPLGVYWQKPYTYSDINGNGLIDCPTGVGTPACEVTLDANGPANVGSPFPKSEITFSPALTLGSNVRVTATLDRRGGQTLFNLTNYYRDVAIGNSYTLYQPEKVSLDKQAAAVAARSGGTFAGYVEDNSFTKLREVAVTFTLPQSLNHFANAQNTSLTISGRNLHTWTNYSGLDPEVNAAAQANFSTADFLTAPQVRYFTARLSMSF